MKRIALIGSTGYIGTQTLQIVEKYPDKFKIVSLTANENSELLIAQAKKFKPEYAGICDGKQYRKVRDALLCEVGCGAECLKVAASVNCDIVLVAVVGCVGLNDRCACEQRIARRRRQARYNPSARKRC